MSQVPEFYVVSLFPYTGNDDSSLNFDSGERLVVSFAQGEWYGGYRVGDPDKFGYFPKTYVKTVSKNEAPPSATIQSGFIWRETPTKYRHFRITDIKGVKTTSYVFSVTVEDDRSSSPLTSSRTYSEFLWLHSVIARDYPQLILPRLPPKRISGRVANTIVKRKRKLEHYMNYVLAHPVLRTLRVLEDFIEQKTPREYESSDFWRSVELSAVGRLDEDFVGLLERLAKERVREFARKTGDVAGVTRLIKSIATTGTKLALNAQELEMLFQNSTSAKNEQLEQFYHSERLRVARTSRVVDEFWSAFEHFGWAVEQFEHRLEELNVWKNATEQPPSEVDREEYYRRCLVILLAELEFYGFWEFQILKEKSEKFLKVVGDHLT